ncbi:MAG: aminotransferase class V-fold PLP-dependent enzyme [Deltaproteobacteria bacterium]|jgi:cysteine desulfurase family protein|nr:aminotransferase class V-fold PLP-dependent enzyme [Deltaproteobacteria bacterium]
MGKLIYLDNGATSYPKPEEVYIFMDSFFRGFGVNPGRSGYDMCMETGVLVDDTRQMMADFFGGKDPNRLCFGYNSTDALNLIIFGLLNSGDHAISTTVEHNSVLRPLYHQSQLHDVEVDYVPFDAKGFVDPDDIKQKIKSNTRLVIINHVSNVIGTVQPVADIGRICREHGVTFAIDASQSAGKVPIDIDKMNIDVLAFTGHKSLMGPTGIGGLYVREGIDIRHTRAGGTGVRSADRMHLDDYPYRLEYGTGNVMGIAGLHAGLKWIEQKGIENIHAHEMKLAQMARDGLMALDGVTLHCQDDLTDHISVLSFNIDGMEALDTGTLLDGEYDIACRTGLHCAPLVHEQLGTDKIGGSVRIGIGPFNTEDHIKTTIEAVGEIAEFKKKKKRNPQTFK